jgi:hypothetical protein
LTPETRTTPAEEPAPFKDLFTGEANDAQCTTAPCVVACSPAGCTCPRTVAEAIAEHTAAMLLTPPVDLTFDQLWQWGFRLRAGVAARTITHRAANEAWRRARARAT